MCPASSRGTLTGIAYFFLGAAFLAAGFFAVAFDVVFLAAGFFAAGLELLLVERAAFSVILLSQASISASSETGETVIAGAIDGATDCSAETASLVDSLADFTLFAFFEVRD